MQLRSRARGWLERNQVADDKAECIVMSIVWDADYADKLMIWIIGIIVGIRSKEYYDKPQLSRNIDQNALDGKILLNPLASPFTSVA